MYPPFHADGKGPTPIIQKLAVGGDLGSQAHQRTRGHLSKVLKTRPVMQHGRGPQGTNAHGHLAPAKSLRNSQIKAEEK